MLFSTYAQTLNGQHPAVTLGHVTTLRGPFLVSRTGNDDPSLPPRRVSIQNASVCSFKKFPCVPAASPHVSCMWAWCRCTRGNVYTGFFHVFFGVAQHTKHTPRPQRHTLHDTTRRQKQKETEKERQDKQREDETRQQGKRREEMKKKREEEERRSRGKMKEKLNRDKQFFHECPPAPELIRPNVRDVRQHWN